VVRDVERVEHALVAVLVDSSASMSMRDAAGPGPEPLRRHDAARRMLARDGEGLLGGLSRRNRVELFTFDAALRSVLKLPRADEGSNPEAVALPEWEPVGPVTDIAGALRDALTLPDRLAAVILITDGRSTAGADPITAAGRAAERGVPVHVVGIGRAAAPANVAVVSLDAREESVAGQPLAMQATVRSDGYEGRTVRLVLAATELDTGASHEVLARTVNLRGDGSRQAVDLTHVPPAAGRLRYVATVEALDGESLLEDNAATTVVTITERGVQVLLVAGGPSVDYRFLKALLEREPTYEPTVFVHASGIGGLAALPARREDLMPYSAVVLCDPSPEDVRSDWVELLAELVDREGMGLVYVAGPVHSPELLATDVGGRLLDLLPVEVDVAAARGLIGPAGYFTDGHGVELAEDGRGHPVTGPPVGEDLLRFWSGLPPLYWVFPARRLKPGAAALLRWRDLGPFGPAGRGTIVAAAGPYGLGRVFYCGTPETWRWRRRGIEYYETFWLRVLRYCTAGAAGTGRRFTLSTDRTAYGIGDAVTVRARLLDERFRPLKDETVPVRLEREGARLGTLTLTRVGDGLYRGVTYAEQYGRFELVYADAGGREAGTSFQVRRPDVEFLEPGADVQAMQELASATGGRMFGPEEVSELVEAIPDATRVRVEEGPLHAAWDRALLLALLVCALTAEWVLRKAMGLV